VWTLEGLKGEPWTGVYLSNQRRRINRDFHLFEFLSANGMFWFTFTQRFLLANTPVGPPVSDRARSMHLKKFATWFCPVAAKSGVTIMGVLSRGFDLLP